MENEEEKNEESNEQRPSGKVGTDGSEKRRKNINLQEIKGKGKEKI